ncbi:MAG TPA: cytochrome c biogenesis protein CcdA [Clostridiales bacterium]|nr:cytochrome c biogenesis protein CcdA [Clostridiales bacterium]
MNDVTFSVAFVAGITSFFSPCILPLIPAYIAFMAGVSVDDNTKKGRFLILTRTAGFIVGFTIIFVLLGAAASALGTFISKNLNIFRVISGIFIIFFGLTMLGVIKLDMFKFASKVKTPKSKGFLGSILMGMALSIGWTPCIGAVLGSILFVAAGQTTFTYGILLLLVYSLGFAIPFIIVSLILDKFDKNISKFEKASVYINKIGGVIIIILGILIMFNKLTLLNNFFL